MDKHVFVLSGVSCGGKSTILTDFDGKLSPGGRQLKVMHSFVTRDLRDGEQFRTHITRQEYDRRAFNLEWIQHVTYGVHSYSVARSDVQAAWAEQKTVLVDCVSEGFRQFQAEGCDVKGCFIYAMPRELHQRHIKRGTTGADLRFRLESSLKELEEALDSGLYSLFLHNTELSKTEQRILAFLDGAQVESDAVDLNEFRNELWQVLQQLPQ